MACVALPTCGLALAESERYLPELIDALDERLAAHGLADDDIVIRMTGCPNGCARPYLAEIGLVGKGPGPLQPLSRRGVRRLAAVQALRRGPATTTASSQRSIRCSPPMRKDAQPGERFGEFAIRAGFVAQTGNGRDFHANVSKARAA